jgi:hypothetical protein
MRQLTYTMHFRGQASRSGENSTVLRTTSSGTSSVMRTVVGPDGVETTLQPADGDLAFFESEVHITPPDSFEGKGTLTFGEESAHEIRLSTLRPGYLGPSADHGHMAGTVSWKIEGGEGQFASASGFIASTFTLSDAGEVSEYQCGLILIPQ